MCSDLQKKHDFQKTYTLSKEYLTLAREANSKAEEGYAKFYLGVAEVFLGKTKEGENHLKEALRAGEDTKDDHLIGLALNSLGIFEANVNTNYYLAQHYFLRSLNYARTEASASSNLANLAALLNDTTGTKYSLRCIEIGKANGEPHFEFSGYQTLSEFDILKGRYKEATRHLEKAFEIAEREGYNDMAIKLLKAEVMMSGGDYRPSIRLLSSIEDTVRNSQPIYLPKLMALLGENYRNIGDFLNSNKYLQEALEASGKYSSNSEMEKINLLIARNYSDLGQFNKGFEYLEQAMERLYVKSQTELSRLSNERNMTLNVIHEEQRRKDAEKKAHDTQIVVFALSFLLFASVAVIWWIISSMKRKRSCIGI